MIKTDAELNEALEKLARLYRATRHEFSSLTITEKNAARLIIGTGKIVDGLTVLISEIEEYTGAAEIRRLTQSMKEIRGKRRG